MSDQTVPTAPVEERPRRTLAVLLAVLGLAAALGLAYMMFAGDNEEETVSAPAEQTTADADKGGDDPSKQSEQAPPPAGDAATVPVQTYEVFLSRDPFKPIRAAAGGTTGGGGSTGDAAAPGDTTTGDTTEPAPGDKNTGDRGSVEGRTVVLLDVTSEDGTERAVVEVDGTSHEVAEGDTFAETFRVLSIDPPCATFLYGDQAFTLCEGERALK